MVVEDFAPFCQFICKTPAKYPSIQIICEAGGAGTVQKATEPKPDLILRDIGHPTLNGIAAARQSPKLAARSKIFFVSQKSSPDMVQEGFNAGA
jgi:DNA-binding NarL/FixJ family response regulator